MTAGRLASAVRMVRAGDALLAPAVTRRLVERFARHQEGTTPHRDLSTLTPRELDILRLIARGPRNTELAARLQIGEATVKAHVTRILSMLSIRDRTQAIIAAYETGLVVPGAGAEARCPAHGTYSRS